MGRKSNIIYVVNRNNPTDKGWVGSIHIDNMVVTDIKDCCMFNDQEWRDKVHQMEKVWRCTVMQIIWTP